MRRAETRGMPRGKPAIGGLAGDRLWTTMSRLFPAGASGAWAEASAAPIGVFWQPVVDTRLLPPLRSRAQAPMIGLVIQTRR